MATITLPPTRFEVYEGLVTDINPLLEESMDFPENLLAVYWPEKDKYAIASLPDNVEGLAVFTDPDRATKFARFALDIRSGAKTESEGEIVQMTFDEARTLTKRKGLPLVAVILCDSPLKPIIHWVR
jgi:hypothetical protein